MDQQSFFAPGQFRVTPTPGDLHPADWLEQPSVKFHGTTVHPDLQPHLQSETHYGPRGMANDQALRNHGNEMVASQSHLYDDGDEISAARVWDGGGDDEHMPIGDTRVHARRVHSISEGRYTDVEANRAHATRAAMRGDQSIPASIHDSLDVEYVGFTPSQRVEEAVHDMDRGRAISYFNDIEPDPDARASQASRSRMFATERQPNSWVVPDPAKTTSSWEEDVLASPNRSHMAQQFAGDRLARGQELLAPIRQQYSPGDQGTISHYSMTDAAGVKTWHTKAPGPSQRLFATAEIESKPSPFGYEDE